MKKANSDWKRLTKTDSLLIMTLLLQLRHALIDCSAISNESFLQCIVLIRRF